MEHWIEIERPAPVLNTPDFSSAFGGKSGKEIHPHYFEWVALEGMRFQVIEQKDLIYQIVCPSYPSSPLYIDARFTTQPAGETKKFQIPSRAEVLNQMEKLLGIPYVWGGNWSFGIPELLEYYPPKGTLDERTLTLWTFKGVDCSGLLFQILRGTTPRNTSQLIHFGKALPITHLPIDQILPRLEPLDMILYPGHVLFVFDEEHIIESKSPFGVRKYKLKERLFEIDSEGHFMIRRF